MLATSRENSNVISKSNAQHHLTEQEEDFFEEPLLFVSQSSLCENLVPT